MRVAPYTTRTGLQIGKYYQKVQRLWPSGDMERLQTALLRDARPLITPRRVLDAVLWTASVVMIVALFVLGLKFF